MVAPGPPMLGRRSRHDRTKLSSGALCLRPGNHGAVVSTTIDADGAGLALRSGTARAEEERRAHGALPLWPRTPATRRSVLLAGVRSQELRDALGDALARQIIETKPEENAAGNRAMAALRSLMAAPGRIVRDA